MRSVPPPSSGAAGWAARASSTPASVVGRSSANSAERLHQAPPVRGRGRGALPLLDGGEHPVGRYRQIVEAHAVASAMALVSAGRNAASEPSPASLAPNGPCGSLLSTMPTSIGGESWMVGTR